MAEELVVTGVTANILTPGGLTNNSRQPWRAVRPLEMIQPEDMVPPLLWLIS